MQLKKLDKTLDGILWVLFLALAGVALWWTISIKAPKLEYVESEKIPYVYTADDGGKYNSYYQLAWYHEKFHKPVPVAADPNNGRMVTFKEEYVDEYKAMMTPSMTAIMLFLKSISSMDAASVPVQAPVPGRGMPTNSINATNRPLPAFACNLSPPFLPFSRQNVKNFPITGLSQPHSNTFLANR